MRISPKINKSEDAVWRFRSRRIFLLAVAFLFLLCRFSFAKPSDSRSPSVAGGFYPANPNQLSLMIDLMLGQVPEEKPEGKLFALIVPHAGYVFSGQVAAYGYKLLKGQAFETVILLGPSHHANFNGASIWQEGDWQTPLGTVPIDSELAKAIAGENPVLSFPREPHVPEHSLEVQIPFLQKVLANFKIVPVALGNQDLGTCRILANAILKHLNDKKILILVSTDLSHYHPYDAAVKLDLDGLDLVQQGNAAQFQESLLAGKCEFCGGGGVMTVLEIAKTLGYLKPQVLKYANSGDVTGEKGRVVGYASVAFFQREMGSADSSSGAVGN